MRSDRTRERILRVAERLFAAEGFNGPSLRQIAIEADQSNASVIQYHFADRDNLVREIFLARVLALEPIRRRMLEAARKAELLDDPAALVRILCLPILDLTDEEGHPVFAEFLLEFILRYRGPADSSHPFDLAPDRVPALVETIGRINRRFHYVPEDSLARRRITCVVIFLVNVLRARDLGAEGAALAQATDEALLLAAQAFLAPLPPPR